MIGVVALDGVLTKNGVLSNTLATTTNGNLTFSQLTFQFGLQGYAFLVYVLLKSNHHISIW